MTLQIEIIERRLSEDCGCPEEEWMVGSLVVTLHQEDDGTGHILLDAGDWEHDWETETGEMTEMLAEAVAYIAKLPAESE